MPKLERGGAELSYQLRGAGPFVILQHPLTSDGRAWTSSGIVARIVDAGFCCVVPDALGHGKSGQVSDERAGLLDRTEDLVAVADAVGAAHFHYVGYSMGGWIGMGLVRSAPDRLLSLSIAGWDPIDGARRFTKEVDTASRRREFLQHIVHLARQTSGGRDPDQMRVEGYLDTYDRLFIDLPSITCLNGLDIPLSFAVGRDDPYRSPVEAAAEALGVDCFLLPGDHLRAFMSDDYRAGLVTWLAKVQTQ